MAILANIAFPWLWDGTTVALMMLTGCMLAESLFIRPLAEVKYLKALGAAALVNLASTTVGWLLRPAIDALVIEVADVPWAWAGEIILPIWIVLTVLVEWPLLSLLLGLKSGRALLTSIVINCVTYLLLFLSIGSAYRLA